jgi:hypothetical protein
MTILELPSLHQSGTARPGRVISGSKKHDRQTPERHRALKEESSNERALPGSNGSCWHETDVEAVVSDVCSSRQSGHRADGPTGLLMTHTRHYRGTETACQQEQMFSFPARVSSPVCAGYQADCRRVGAGRKGDWPAFPAAAENVGVGVRLPGWCRSPLVMEKQCSCLLEQPMQPVRLAPQRRQRATS